MTRPKDEACKPHSDGPNLDELAADWIALWQSELAALAADPDVAAAWRQAFGLGATWLHAAQTPMQQPISHERPADPPGPAPARPAPGDGDGDPLGRADAARLRGRIDELERRLATLESGTAGSLPNRRQPRRRRPLA